MGSQHQARLRMRIRVPGWDLGINFLRNRQPEPWARCGSSLTLRNKGHRCRCHPVVPLTPTCAGVTRLCRCHRFFRFHWDLPIVTTPRKPTHGVGSVLL